MKIKNALITRQPEQSVDLINLLSKNGFYPYLIPMIVTTPIHFELKRAVYDYVILTSPNGVTYFANHIKMMKAEKYVVVGTKTAETLHLQGITNMDIPDVFSQEGLINYFSEKQVQGLHILLPSPEKSSPNLKNFLISKGAVVEKPAIYKTDKLKYENGEVPELLKEFNIDTVIFASPSAAEAFFDNLKKYELTARMTCISIGKTTYEFLKNSLGISSYYPEQSTVKGMVELLNNLRRDYEELSRIETSETQKK